MPLTTSSAAALVAAAPHSETIMKYIELTAAVAINGEHIEAGTILALEAGNAAIGNILSASRGREVDEAAYKAWQARPKSKADKLAA